MKRVIKTNATGLLAASFSLLTIAANTLTASSKAIAESIPKPSPYTIVVNSNQDAIAPDEHLTLREAIALINGTLGLGRLSDAERQQVTSTTESRIGFALPAGQTIITVKEPLPAITKPVTIDGTTQAGYDGSKPAIAELPLAKPIVELTAAQGVYVRRGLEISADNVTVRGLSIYGFTDDHDDTERTPPADIFIAHRLAPPNTSKHPTPANFSPFYKDDVPPRNVVIENNWLGIRPDQSIPQQRSAFGVSVFNATDTQIRRNWIANHDGSAIITSVHAEGLKVAENAIVSNGLAGMPDGIRLDGKVNQAQISGNVICGNDGAGVYMFKPQGSTHIENNRITYNGRRYRRAAVYVMGSYHYVSGNLIANQAGPGVVVTSYPRSASNYLNDNLFSAIEGLSIDLVSQENVSVQDFQRGDGSNPDRNSENRRKDTANGSVNAPKFSSREFVGTQLTGTADPNTRIQLYRVTEAGSAYGPLNEPIGNVTSDANGKFNTTIATLKPGDVISAIATDEQYGTSEPAVNAMIQNAARSAKPNLSDPAASTPPRCTTPPAEPQPIVDPPVKPPIMPIVIKVPKNVHFALDKDFISPASARVLDRITQVLIENPNIVVTLEGHTDPRASNAYNQDLGKRRAISVRNYLIRQGIDAARMTIRSFGETQRISEGSSRVDYARDRRVELNYRDARNIEIIVQEDDLQLEPATGVR